MNDAENPKVARNKYFEGLGPEQVRLMLQNRSMNVAFEVHAREWLALKDQESSRVWDASQAEQISIARSAKDAAWAAAEAARESASEAKEANRLARQANTTATWAMIIAAIATGAALMALFHPH